MSAWCVSPYFRMGLVGAPLIMTNTFGKRLVTWIGGAIRSISRTRCRTGTAAAGHGQQQGTQIHINSTPTDTLFNESAVASPISTCIVQWKSAPDIMISRNNEWKGRTLICLWCGNCQKKRGHLVWQLIMCFQSPERKDYSHWQATMMTTDKSLASCYPPSIASHMWLCLRLMPQFAAEKSV